MMQYVARLHPIVQDVVVPIVDVIGGILNLRGIPRFVLPPEPHRPLRNHPPQLPIIILSMYGDAH